MGTSCEIVRVEGDRVKRIHVSYDGYLSGVGLNLFKNYGTPERVAALFNHSTYAAELAERVDDINWRDWHDKEFVPLADYLAEWVQEEECYPELLDDPDAALGDYVWAHNRWCYPKSVADLRAFIETGESPRVLTRDLFIADMGEEAFTLNIDEAPRDPSNVRTGILSFDREGDFVLKIGRERWTLIPDDNFRIDAGPEWQGQSVTAWTGKLVRVHTTSMAASMSIGPNGRSTSDNVATISRMELADAE